MRIAHEPWVDLTPAHTPAELTHLSIDQMPNLVTTRGLSVRRVRTQCDVWNNPSLTDLAGLETTTLTGSVSILRNPQLRSLGTLRLETDRRFGLRLEVRSNPALTSLGSLGAPTDFTNALLLEDLPALVDLEALRSVRHCNILKLRGTGVTSVAAFEHLETPPGFELSLTIEKNPNLRTLDGLAKVTRLRGALVISDNTQLESLEGLAGLEDVELYQLVIRGNPRLRTLAPLLRAKRLQGVSDDETPPVFEVRDNPLLPAEEIAQLQRRFLSPRTLPKAPR